MSHTEQREYCQDIKNKFEDFFRNKKVLDVGSLDINGANKTLFTDCDYTGLDVAPGRNVDVVSPCHLFDAPNESYDVVVSTECFEHDMYFPQTLLNIIRMLKPGGLLFFTCGGDGRGEHGTLRTDTFSSPLTTQIPEWANYYKNVNESWVREIITPEEVFESFEFSYRADVADFRFWGIKK